LKGGCGREPGAKTVTEKGSIRHSLEIVGGPCKGWQLSFVKVSGTGLMENWLTISVVFLNLRSRT
jgi:hypothetical protein